MKKYFIFLSVVSALAAPFAASAAQIYLDPATGKFPPGVTFGVDIRLDNQNECINAAQVDLAYPKGVLQPVAASDGDSIFSLWIKEPTIYDDYGLVSFTGGLPGGYCGRVAGDPTLSNKLATVYFRFATSTPSAATATLSFLPSTEAFLNDGAGTPAKLTLAGANYAALLTGKYAPVSTWDQAIANDTTPPEPFAVGVYRDPSLFDGKWFAAFSTVDKQTGIDHYEVAEVAMKDTNMPQDQWNWQRAVSPYQIQDQTLGSVIEVRAIDAAGNVRIEHHLPTPPTPNSNQPWNFAMLVAAIGIVGVALLQLILRLL